MNIENEPIRIVVAGHVDHGKSTLIGRLLYDLGALAQGKFEAIEKSCKNRGVDFEWAFLTDALQAERNQNVTIDTSHIRLRADGHEFIIIDAPGHKEFLKNMLTGAALAEAAVILIDAKEGISEQSKSHAHLINFLGIRQLIVVVNKMDAVAYSEEIFRKIENDYAEYLKTLGINPIAFIPASARKGDNIAKHSGEMRWYSGVNVFEAFNNLKTSPSIINLPLRMNVQDVYKQGDKRIIVGRIQSGGLKIGDKIIFSPANARAKIATIESWPENNKKSANAGESIGITLESQVFVERGNVVSDEEAPILSNIFRADIFWLGDKRIEPGKQYEIKLGTQETTAEIKSAEYANDYNIVRVLLRTRRVLAFDEYSKNAESGRFAIMENGEILGGGIINMNGLYDQRALRNSQVKSENLGDEEIGISTKERAISNGHFGGILWFTGLSGAGKSTLARHLHARLFAKGYQVYVLDGDNIRKGLSRDLGFSHSDRSENIRRIAEAAALFANAGIIVITAFISPYEEDRAKARAVLPEAFHEVYVKSSLEACEKRDKKGLYKKARAGEIAEFTGISAPYEVPKNPDIVLDTEKYNIEDCLDVLVDYVEKHLVDPTRTMSRDS